MRVGAEAWGDLVLCQAREFVPERQNTGHSHLRPWQCLLRRQCGLPRPERARRRGRFRLRGGGWAPQPRPGRRDRKSTRLNSSHLVISYAVFCLKKKKKK